MHGYFCVVAASDGWMIAETVRSSHNVVLMHRSSDTGTGKRVWLPFVYRSSHASLTPTDRHRSSSKHWSTTSILVRTFVERLLVDQFRGVMLVTCNTSNVRWMYGVVLLLP